MLDDPPPSASARFRLPPVARAVAIAGGVLLAGGVAVLDLVGPQAFSLRLAAVIACVLGLFAIGGLFVWRFARGPEWKTQVQVWDKPALAALVLGVLASGLLEFALDARPHFRLAYEASAAAWLVLLAVCGAYWWRYGAGHLHHLDATPAPRIGEAAGGWVYVAGEAFLPDGAELPTGISGKRCLWYRYEIEATSAEWEEDEAPPLDSSRNPFAIRDGSGSALVNPLAAEFLGMKKHRSPGGDWQYVEERITPGDRVHVLGHLALVGERADVEQEVSLRLAAWRADPARRAGFDADGDGRLGNEEDWAMRTRALAEAEAEARAAEARAPTRVIGRGDGSRRFLISRRSPAGYARRFRFWAWTGAASLAGAALGIGAVGLRLFAG